MKAVIQTRFGAAHDVLVLDEVKRPTPDANQVLVEVHASSVTQGDRRLRAADYPGISKVIGWLMFGLKTPRNPIPGTNFAGRVVGVGEDVTRFTIGDEVFGNADHSAHAEYLVIAETGSVATLPEGVSYAEGAAAPYGMGTALAMLRDHGMLRAGEHVLVVGASGGVGRFAVQIAKHLGARVSGVASAGKADLVRSLGAESVIDYRTQNYAESGHTWDVVFDTSTGDGFGGAKRVLSAVGRYVTVYLDPLVAWQMLTSRLFGGPRVASGVVLPAQELVEDVAELLAAGVRPVIAQRFPLNRIADAHAALEAGPRGTVVVEVRDEDMHPLREAV